MSEAPTRARVLLCALGRRLVTERDGKSRRSLLRPLVILVDMEASVLQLGAHVHTIDRAIDGSHRPAHFDICSIPDEVVQGWCSSGFNTPLRVVALAG